MIILSKTRKKLIKNEFLWTLNSKKLKSSKNLSFMIQFLSRVKFQVLGSNSKNLESKQLKKFEFIRVILFQFDLCICLRDSSLTAISTIQFQYTFLLAFLHLTIIIFAVYLRSGHLVCQSWHSGRPLLRDIYEVTLLNPSRIW